MSEYRPQFIGSSKDVLPAIMRLDGIREDLRSVLMDGVDPTKRAQIIAETRAIRRRQVLIVEQLYVEEKHGTMS